MQGFTEFTVRASGDNLYAGTLDGVNEAAITPLAKYTNGGWTATNGNYVTTGANPVSNGVVSGHWASIYPDNPTPGTTTPFVGMVMSVHSSGFNVSLVKKYGTAPTVSATARTAVIGGAWGGPSGALPHPFNGSTVFGTLLNSSGWSPRINFKNDKEYGITTGMTYTAGSTSPVSFQGYKNTFGDRGKAKILRSPTGTAILLLSFTGTNAIISDFLFDSNGNASSASALDLGTNFAQRVTVQNSRGIGFNSINSILIECEAYNNNISNTANFGGFITSSNGIATYIRCVASGNLGTNSCGFKSIGTAAFTSTYINCISTKNGADGIAGISTNPNINVINCDIYDNGHDGIKFRPSTGMGVLFVQNSNILKNKGYGIQLTTTKVYHQITNNAFGSGIYINTSGNIFPVQLVHVNNNNFNYEANVTPWVDPDNGNFNLSLPKARFSAIETFPSGIYNSNLLSYSNIGAVNSPYVSFRNITTGGGL